MSNVWRDKVWPLSWMLSIPLLSFVYNVLNHSTKNVHSLVTDFDRTIPFLKIFILPYGFFQLFILLVLLVFAFKDREVYYKTLITINISFLICFAIYFFYQTTVPRPELIGNDLLTKLVRFLYQMDPPFNTFPSIHSLTSFLMIKAINKSKIKNQLIHLGIKGMAVLIIFSTFFVKQHVLLDAIGAILLGDMMFKMVFSLNGERIWLWLKKPSLSLTTKKKYVT